MRLKGAYPNRFGFPGFKTHWDLSSGNPIRQNKTIKNRTQIQISSSTSPINFKVDKPFLYFKYENSTGAIIFPGKVGIPNTPCLGNRPGYLIQILQVVIILHRLGHELLEVFDPATAIKLRPSSSASLLWAREKSNPTPNLDPTPNASSAMLMVSSFWIFNAFDNIFC